MHVIGTAGHIDHGKTTLINRLSGINTDRLQEEQARGMTIDLGFAWLTLPSGEEIGIVDVPGHHRFIKNMVAGVGGIELTLLVIAADDGWMPQTQEHVAILQLLGITKAIVVVTKKDLVDQDWLALVTADIEERLSSTTLAGSPIIPVSSETGENLDQLIQVLDTKLQSLEPSEDKNNPLLWIDRVFSIKGSGTVVTGTLLAGSLQASQEVMIGPGTLTAKIRGLQSHQNQISCATPGSRLAVNLTGLTRQQIHRGMYLALPNKRLAYSLINGYVTMLPSTSKPLAAEQTVKLYTGTHESEVVVKPLDPQEIPPGESGFIQLRLKDPTHFAHNSRFLLRDATIGLTIGGGVFLEEGIPVRGKNLRLVGPNRRNSQFIFEKQQPLVNLELLERKLHASKEELPALVGLERPYWPKEEFLQKADRISPGVETINGFVLAQDNLDKLKAFIHCFLQSHHHKKPLSPGIPKETLRSTLGIPTKLLDGVLLKLSTVQEKAGIMSLTTHRIELSDKQRMIADKLLSLINESCYEPPTKTALIEQNYPEELLFGLVELGELCQLPEEHFTTPAILAEIESEILRLDKENEGFTIGQLRDSLNTSRKYGLVFVDYFDNTGLTHRQGDKRFVKNAIKAVD